MSSLFGIEASRAAQYLIAFAIILVLVALFGLVLRKLTGARLMVPGQDRGRNRQPRLGIVDIYDLDRQRQLVLLRRDNVEHLLLIGGLNDVVIETNIVRVAGARIPAASNDTGPERVEPTLEQAPARPPQVETQGRPSIEAQLAAQIGSIVRRPAEESDPDAELRPVGEISAPMPARPEPVLKPDAVTLSAAPAVQGLRAEAKTPPNAPPVFPSAPAAPIPIARGQEPRPAFTAPVFQSRPTPTPPAPPPAAPAAPAAPPTPPAPPPIAPAPVRPPQPPAPVERQAPQTPSDRPAPDAAVLSDMAKQLEEALKRPTSPIPPRAAPQQPVPPPPAPPMPARAERDEIPDEDDLLEDTAPVSEVAAARPEPVRDEDPVEEPEPAARPEPPRPAVEPVRPAPPPPPPVQPAPAPPPPQAASEASGAPEAAAKKAPDPFSVEDIEAEFARLLGRPLDPGKKG